MKRAYHKGDAQLRLTARLDKSGACWLWLGALRNGYGAIKLPARVEYAHRLAWTLANGPIPEGRFVCHTCDVKRCCNPGHMFLRKGRGRNAGWRGKSHPNAVLSDQIVRAIRKRCAHGESQASVARELGVSLTCVHQVVRGRTWSHVA